MIINTMDKITNCHKILAYVTMQRILKYIKIAECESRTEEVMHRYEIRPNVIPTHEPLPKVKNS